MYQGRSCAVLLSMQRYKSDHSGAQVTDVSIPISHTAKPFDPPIFSPHSLET